MTTQPKPYEPPATPAGKVNVTDPDSKNLKTPRGYIQGYNAQAAVNEDQIVIAAEINTGSQTSGTSARWSTPRSASSPRPASASSPA